jgi:uncharacterized membrane protein YqjE
MSLLDSIESRPQVPSLGTAIRLFTEALGNRADLAALELEETRAEASISTILAGVVICLVHCAGFAFTLMVAAFVWDSPHRGAWLAALGGVYLVAAAIAALRLSRRLRAWRPFAETKSQLKQDHQCLKELSKSIFH